MALNQEILRLQPLQGVPNSPRWQKGFFYQVLLCQLTLGLQYSVHELCRWWQVPDVFWVIAGCFYNKNDPS